jgi:hypothetical protein
VQIGHYSDLIEKQLRKLVVSLPPMIRFVFPLEQEKYLCEKERVAENSPDSNKRTTIVTG